jgi:REP element-mobilizing transposase RayT
MSQPRQIVPGRVYLVTRRCTQRQFLLRPDRETNGAFVYCLAVAAQRTGVQVVAFIANSNHHHLVVVDVEGRLPEFLEDFHKHLAKHQNAHRGRWENCWSSEKTSVVHLVGPDDVFAKMIYTLTNPAKDHLVERAHSWPGASSYHATISGKVLTATKPRKFFNDKGPRPQTIELRCVRPPGFESLTAAAFGKRVLDAITEVETAAAAERCRTGRTVLGRKTVLAQKPSDRPKSHEPRRQLDPNIAARDKWPRIEAILALKAFRDDYKKLRSRWLGGDKVRFPAGTWWLRKFAAVACHPCPSTA